MFTDVEGNVPLLTSSEERALKDEWGKEERVCQANGTGYAKPKASRSVVRAQGARRPVWLE